MNSSDFEYIREFIRDQAAIILEPGKEYLVESRLLPLAKQGGFSSLEAFIQSFKGKAFNDQHLKIVDALTTNETLFFRDIHPFETLKKVILPELILKRGKEKRLTIWCAAASSGQEPYTLAMILKDNPILNDWNVTLIASDISEAMLERARLGIFNQLEVNRGLPALYLAKYFEKKEGNWQIKEPLRKMIDFRKINLANPFPSLPQCDLLFMRNVLIYFDTDMKISILKKVRSILKSDGYFFLGGAETTVGLDDHFERVRFEKTTCYQTKN